MQNSNDGGKSLNNSSNNENSSAGDDQKRESSISTKAYPKLSLQTSESKKVSLINPEGIHHNPKIDTKLKNSNSGGMEKEISSPLKKMMGILGKGFGSIQRGIGSGIGTIGKGIGNMKKGLGLSSISNALKLNQLGKGLGMVSKGLGLNRLGRGLGNLGREGFKQLNILSKGLGLDVLGKGLNNLSKMGLDQLGKGLKDLKQGQYLKKIQEQLKKIAGINSDVLTEREKKIQFIKGHLKRSDTIAAIIALLCLVLSYYENDDFYNPVVDSSTGEIIKPGNVSTPWGNAIRGAIMLMTCAIMVCVYLNYHFRLKILKLKRLILEQDNIYTAGLLPKLVFELFICSICCPPYFDYTFKGYVLSGTYEYSYNAIINVITILKSYLVLRTYQHYSTWSNEKAVRVCKKNRCQASVKFAIKAELKRWPYLMLGILMVVTMVYLGLCIRTFEISYEPSGNNFDFSFLANDMWLIMITMTTVGFGEGYPSTHLGRFIGVCACLIGMLLVSLMVVSLTLSSEFTQEESKAYFILKRVYANDNAKDKAANVIKVLFKLRETVQRKDPSSYTLRFVWLAKLKKNLKIFTNDYRVANSHNLPVDERLKNLEERLITDIKDLKDEFKAVPNIEEKTNEIKVHQLKIHENLNDIIRSQRMIGEYFFNYYSGKIDNTK